jgi:snRNA-activating protein complex subunit 3
LYYISRTTIDWAKTRDFPTFHQAKMEDTRFYDLKVKVGYPYLFCHQGDCEHVVIITDIRSEVILSSILIPGF